MSHASAGDCWGFRPFNAAFETVTRAGNGGPRRFGGVLVSRSTILTGNSTRRDGIPITTAERTIIDLAPHHGGKATARIVREAIRLKVITADRLAAAVDRHPTCPGARVLRELARRYRQLPIVRTRADSEALALEVLDQAGIELPRVNVRIRGEEADLVWFAWKLIVEIDGPRFHQFKDEDLRKQGIWESAGYAVRRISSDDVYERPHLLIALVEALRRHRGNAWADYASRPVLPATAGAVAAHSVRHRPETGRMALAEARWTCTPYSVADAARLAADLGVSRTLATILVRRGFADAHAARGHLAAEERHDPFAFAGMKDACELLLDHVRRGSRIVVHGDYDVDGVCSTAIVLTALRSLGAHPAWHIPARDDGYGLSTATVEREAASATRLLVTTDCGIGSVAEIARARELGMDVLVTDHHRPGDVLPAATVIHPGVSGYPFEQLCAAGVAQKLAEALLKTAGEDPAKADADADLVGLATVADVVPLRGENRRLVRAGLAALSRTRRHGLRALMRIAGVDPATVDEHALGFRLAPRINAAGRLARAEAALELVLTEDEQRAERIADELDLLNRERQDVETRILFAAEAARADHPEAPSYVLAGEGWHPGVIGIVASRMVERHHRPCVMVALDGDRGKGSGRSISAFDLHAGLAACSEHLVRFGGHRAAAGLEIESERVDDFRTAFVAHAAAALSPSDLVPTERIDAVVGPDQLGVPLAEELESLRPFGHGNPTPSLLIPAARVGDVRGMGGEGEHSRFTIAGGGARARAVAFRVAASALPESLEDRYDAAVRLELNEWNGTVEPRLILRALCPTELGSCRAIGAERPFLESFERALRAIASDRDEAADPPTRSRTVHDRRREGFAGLAGELISSGETVAIVCADAERRRPVLEEVIGGVVHAIAGTGTEEFPCPCVISWDELALEPALGRRFPHLIALDPPREPGAVADVAATAAQAGDGAGTLQLAWGPEEIELALAVARRDLTLRPLAASIYRRLREREGRLEGQELEAALRGHGAHPLPPVVCARAVAALSELDLVSVAASDSGGFSIEAHDRPRTRLDLSPTYRAASAALAAAERYLGREAAAPARAA